MSKGHREAQLKITQHSHSIVERKETLCTGPVQTRSGDEIRGDPNSWAVEHLPNRFSHLHHQNLRASVDMVAVHHNVCGKRCHMAAARARGWSHSSSTEPGCWACSAVKGRLGIPPPWLAPDPNTSPDLGNKPGNIAMYGQKPSRCSQKVSLTLHQVIQLLHTRGKGRRKTLH